jgi:amino acid adenylation domain-containing protein/non-ribosomal peptide synthase protein (TIGR01720 family)
MTPTSAAYNIAIAWQFTGQLDPVIVRSSLNAIVQRHESLRTAIAVEQGQPCPQIAAQLRLEMPIVDLRSLTSEQRGAERDRIADQEARQPFDLRQAPLMRATLIVEMDRTWTLLLTLHHLIADGWSRGVLLREFAQHYRAIALGEVLALPALPIQYADYAQWQRQTWTVPDPSSSGSFNPTAAQTYWQQQLADLAVLELPTDEARPAMPSGRGATVAAQLPIALLQAVKLLARQAGVTVFMVLLAAFKLLLHRYTEQTDIAVGVPVANRDRPEVEGLIGFFVNTLVLRSRLSAISSFRDLLQQVHQVTADAFAYQEMPFSQVVELLHPDRHLSHNPLFQVMFQFQNQAYQLQNASAPALQLPDLEMTQTWRDLGSTKFDLTWHLIEQPNGIQAVVEYSTDLFRAETIVRMVQQFQTLLENILRDPSQRLAQISLLTPIETHQLITWGCGLTDDSLLTPLLHQRFESQVAQTPQAIAVVFGDQSLTYAALNRQANQLAHELRSRGVGAETLVGVYLERSPLLLVALLAVLKAGAAYVPLDVKLGRDRLNFMLSDAQPWLVLTTSTLAAQLPETTPVLSLDGDRIESDRNLDLPIPGDQLAYVIYTSGSTGVPKGTLLTHAGLANYLNWCSQAYAIAEGNGAPVQSAIGFDATITSLYAPLLVGRTVYLLPETDEILALRDAIQTQPDLSLVKLTPAHLEALSYLLPPAANPHAPRSLIIGGEALTEPHLKFWRTYAPTTRLINEYGPTETVVGCCVYDAAIDSTTIDPNSFQVPIGRPIANTQLYVFDRHLQLVPMGVPGELYIGGAGVARGYLHRAELTAARFIPNPFGQGRLYKTGDRVRWRSDGNLEYLGRLDHQVKIRGFRVELGEVEAVLMQHDAIAQVIVSCQSDSRQQPRLIAHLVAANPTTVPTTAELRAFLAPKLPDYMQPTQWIWLDQVPLTANGKVDRAALPQPRFDPIEVDRTAPHTEAEQTLVQIWRELLRLDAVGIHSNFFELGGDSILSLQVIARANQAGLSLTPKQLFQHQTIAELAAIAQPLTPPSAPSTEVIGSVPLTPIQSWLVEQNLHNLDHYNQAMLLQVVPGLNPNHLQTALHHLWEYHEALRLHLSRTETDWLQEYGSSPPPPLISIDLSGLPPSAQATAIAQAATTLHTSLSLAQGDLMRSALIHLGHHQPDRLLWIIHHWVVDGVSWRILLADLALAVQQLEGGRAIQLPPKTTSLQTWSQHLVQLAHSDLITRELDDWIELAAIAVPPLPVDYPAATAALNTVAAAAELSFSLDPESTQALLKQAPQAYRMRVDEVLLTALVQSLAPWTRSRQILVDLEHHGREAIGADLDLTRTVGWLTTLYPVVLNLRDIHEPGASLKAIKEQLRRIPNYGLGYGLGCYGRKSVPQCQPQIRFNYLGQLDLGQLDQGQRDPQPPFSLGLAPESSGALQHPQNLRPHLLVFNSVVLDRQLQMRWQYGLHFHDRATIEQLADSFISALQNLIQHCQRAESGGFTPSDVAGARLNQAQLDQFLAKIQSQK